MAAADPVAEAPAAEATAAAADDIAEPPPKKRRAVAARLFKYLVLDKPNCCDNLSDAEIAAAHELTQEWTTCGHKTSINIAKLAKEPAKYPLGLWVYFSYDHRLAFTVKQQRGGCLLLGHRFGQHPPLLVPYPPNFMWNLDARKLDAPFLPNPTKIVPTKLSGELVATWVGPATAPIWMVREHLLRGEEMSKLQRDNVTMLLLPSQKRICGGIGTVQTFFPHLFQRRPARPVRLCSSALLALSAFFFVGFGRGGHCGVRTIRSVYYNLICTYLHFVRWISFSAWCEKVETGTRSKNAVPFCMFEILFPHLLILHFSVCKQTHTQILGSAFTLSGLRNPSQRFFRSMLAIFLQLQNMEITSLQNHDMFHHVKQSWRKVLPVFGPTVDIP